MVSMDSVVPMSWRRVALVMLAAILAAFTIEPVLDLVVPVPPALPLVVVTVIAAQNGPLYGVVSGMVAGLLIDFLGAGALGVNMGSLAVVGFAVGRAIRYLPLWPQPLRVLLVAPLTALQVPAAWLFSALAGTPAAPGIRAAALFVAGNMLCVLLATPIVSAARLR